MIFAPDLAAQVSRGRKTVTRRPVKHVSGGFVSCRYYPGRTYAVQLRRGGIAIERILVKSVTRETLTFPLPADEAAAEGFRSAREFEQRWLELYGPDGPRDVWRIEFELIP